MFLVISNTRSYDTHSQMKKNNQGDYVTDQSLYTISTKCTALLEFLGPSNVCVQPVCPEHVLHEIWMHEM